MIDAETIREERLLRRQHVLVAVLRELRAEAVARLARLPVADVVRKDDEVLRRVERLSRHEQLARESAADELTAGATRAMHDQDGVRRDSLRVFPRHAERAVMDPKLRQRLA